MIVTTLLLVLLVQSLTRPIPQQRLFVDQCVQTYITEMKSSMSPKLYDIFEKSFPNTLDTTIYHHNADEPLTYIITGDIPAMWLRDSTNQVIPYIRIPEQCHKIKVLVQGLLNMQAKFIMLDPYTNAFVDYYKSQSRPFYLNDNTYRHFLGIKLDLQNKTQYLTSKIWERKWEIDSLAAFLRLGYQYFQKYGLYDFVNVNFVKALKRIIQVIQETIQDDSYEGTAGQTAYMFFRTNQELPYGKMGKAARTGLIRTGFRPSDDPNQLVFNIPGNAMISTYLGKMHSILEKMPSPFYNKLLSQTLHQMKSYSDSIRTAIYTYGVAKNAIGHSVFAYEIDGLGKYVLYDDSNLPSLISLPYLHFVQSNDTTYQNTRRTLLSKQNKYYYQNPNNKTLKGIGSSHTSLNQVWPLAIIAQALTSSNKTQISECLLFLKATSINNQVHQAVNVNNVNDYTREWFAWANGFFGELIIDLKDRFPQLIMK